MPSNTGNSVVKSTALLLLVLQNCALILFMKQSVRVGLPKAKRYMPIVAVTMNELIKFVTCCLVLFFQGDFTKGLKEAFGDSRDFLLASLPAFLYFLQNNLLYFAVSRLDTAVFQVTYQLKILTTAFFSVIMLKKRLCKLQWFALFLLVPGIALVQISSTVTTLPHQKVPLETGVVGETGIERSAASGIAIVTNSKLRGMSGFLAVIAACITSGFAGVYFELVLKNKRGSMWSRNLQLSCTSFIIGSLSVLFTKYQTVTTKGLFHGFSPSAVTTVCLQALGGLVVAAVVKYADNIIKAFATSISILLSCIVSFFLFDWEPSIYFSGGATLVGCSVYLYATGSIKPKHCDDSGSHSKISPEHNVSRTV
jgi:solute carrier family 35 (UDP-sugar transporter), member A1/2/3